MRNLLLLIALALPLAAQDYDDTVKDILAKSGAPSASIAIVRDGKIVYEHAYGNSRLEPPTSATTQMRYSIGSISKQFTAAAILMLAEEGKLSLDDKVVRFLPEATRAKDVTIRQLLSMTSGYQDFWPQDYVMPMMKKPVTAEEIVKGWAQIPLDFEPGTKWQYSNTNYVMAGMIVEKVAGMPLIDLLRARVFTPLHMTSVFNTDEAPLTDSDPQRYLRYAAGPPRVAPKEGKGWMYAAGELAMTPHDLALWDISMIDQTVLQPESYRAMQTAVVLANGLGTKYGLGVRIDSMDGHRQISHGGEVSGFTAQNQVYPDDHAAVVVLTNIDATNASELIATALSKQILASTDAPALALVQKIFEGLQKGQLDRSLFTSNANSYFDAVALKDFASSLGPLGKPKEFTQLSQSLRGGMTLRRYKIVFPNRTLRLTTFTMPDGKLEQYQIAAAED